MKAIIFNGSVIACPETAVIDSDKNQIFTPGMVYCGMDTTAVELVEVDADITGRTYSGGVFYPSSAEIAARLEELAALRYEKETGGITVGGMSIRSDRETQAMLSGALQACQIDSTRTINWKGPDGWITIGATEITALSAAMADHVQACFTREKELSEALTLDINTDITVGWP